MAKSGGGIKILLDIDKILSSEEIKVADRERWINTFCREA
jgi:hypothetical protein